MIYFIGAGPGAADLITVKGKDLLEKADLIEVCKTGMCYYGQC